MHGFYHLPPLYCFKMFALSTFASLLPHLHICTVSIHVAAITFLNSRPLHCCFQISAHSTSTFSLAYHTHGLSACTSLLLRFYAVGLYVEASTCLNCRLPRRCFHIFAQTICDCSACVRMSSVLALLVLYRSTTGVWVSCDTTALSRSQILCLLLLLSSLPSRDATTSCALTSLVGVR